MDRSATDMTDVEARSLGHVLHDGLAGLNAVRAARCLVAVAALLLVLVTLDPFPDLRNEDVTDQMPAVLERIADACAERILEAHS